MSLLTASSFTLTWSTIISSSESSSLYVAALTSTSGSQLALASSLTSSMLSAGCLKSLYWLGKDVEFVHVYVHQVLVYTRWCTCIETYVVTCLCANLSLPSFLLLCSYHIRNFSLEGLPFFLGVAIYCYEVSCMFFRAG